MAAVPGPWGVQCQGSVVMLAALLSWPAWVSSSVPDTQVDSSVQAVVLLRRQCGSFSTVCLLAVCGVTVPFVFILAVFPQFIQCGHKCCDGAWTHHPLWQQLRSLTRQARVSGAVMMVRHSSVTSLTVGWVEVRDFCADGPLSSQRLSKLSFNRWQQKCWHSLVVMMSLIS